MLGEGEKIHSSPANFQPQGTCRIKWLDTAIRSLETVIFTVSSFLRSYHWQLKFRLETNTSDIPSEDGSLVGLESRNQEANHRTLTIPQPGKKWLLKGIGVWFFHSEENQKSKNKTKNLKCWYSLKNVPGAMQIDFVTDRKR